MLNPFILFVPNKLSVSSLIVDDEHQPLLYKFLSDYFYGIYKGKQELKPFASAGLMLEEVEEEAFDNTSIPCEEEYAPCYASVHDWLTDVISNFGEDTTLICSHYC